MSKTKSEADKIKAFEAKLNRLQAYVSGDLTHRNDNSRQNKSSGRVKLF